MGERALPYLALLDEPEVAGPAALDHLRPLFLNSGRILLLSGTLLVMSTVGNPGAGDVRAFLGFLLLLLGVVLIMLSPMANQLPGPARAGAAMANAVVPNRFFALGN